MKTEAEWKEIATKGVAGFVLAQRTAEYMYNTLANLMFTSGNSAELANEGIVTGKWTPEVVQFNS